MGQAGERSWAWVRAVREKKRKNGSRGGLVAGWAERERRRGEGESVLEKGEVLGCQREGEKKLGWTKEKRKKNF